MSAPRFSLFSTTPLLADGQLFGVVSLGSVYRWGPLGVLAGASLEEGVGAFESLPSSSITLPAEGLHMPAPSLLEANELSSSQGVTSHKDEPTLECLLDGPGPCRVWHLKLDPIMETAQGGTE